MDRGKRGPTASRTTRRVGQKAISIGRTHNVIERKLGIVKPVKKTRLPKYNFKLWHFLAPAAITLVIGGVFGYQQFTIAQKAAAAKQAHDEEIKRKESVAAQEESCRKQKMTSNADKIGTITYAELYNGECTY